MELSTDTRLDEIGLTLLQRYSALTRAVFAQTKMPVSRTEAGVLGALSARPRRVTELATVEGITQPAATQLVNRLERRGWVEREGDPTDARAVLVRLTDPGTEVLETLRSQFRAVLHEELAGLDDEDVETLAAAVAVVDRLVARVGDDPR